METKYFVDMMGNKLEIHFPPKRIVSLVPSQTELLFDLGLEEEVIGITKFCVHPQQWWRNKLRVGGTKKLHIDKILALNPDLIIANKEENTQTEIEFLATKFPVWVSDIGNIAQAMEMIRTVGDLVNKSAEASVLLQEIKSGFDALRPINQPKRIAYFIWKDPWMTIGHDTFIHSMINHIGWKNVYATQTRYPETTLEVLRQLAPEIVLLSSEPYPFKEKHIAELQAILPDSRIQLVDGEMFSWYGSRMKLACGYLAMTFLTE
jgi:ABC-type Fe3+-hydroxamate transport system substrate-binding protein